MQASEKKLLESSRRVSNSG